MNHKRLVSQMVSLTLVALLLTACSVPQPTSTLVPPGTTPPTAVPPTPVPPTPAPPTPTAVPAPPPSPRGYISMAYDVESDRGILFGGQTGDWTLNASYNSETWTYDVSANKWTEMKPISGPGIRVAADLIYDAESDRVLLFGGADPYTMGLDDTWAYDFNANTWREMARGPANLLGARLAYDAESDRVILFGGYHYSLLNDTWAYDFNSDTWTEMKPSTSPSPRNFHAMAYDAESDRVIIWGGSDPSVWAYDYNQSTWQKMPFDSGPSPRDYPSMAYDPKADRMILYGGFDTGNDETWAYDYNTNTWTKLAPGTNPGELSRHAMMYSTAADRVILFGGQVGATEYKYTDHTWSYDLNANTWTNVTQHNLPQTQ
jgi:hypothetical protein